MRGHRPSRTTLSRRTRGINRAEGERLELVPRDLWNVRLGYSPETGPGAFVAVRHQGIRPLTRRNTFNTEAF
jgi:hypothetical protein